MKQLSIKLIFLLLCIFNIKAQNNKITIWRDSSGIMTLCYQDTCGSENLKSYIKKQTLENGVYVVYIGKNELSKFTFPSITNYLNMYDVNFLFERSDAELLISREQFPPVKDTLPDGKWLKVNITSNDIFIFKEKNIEKGKLHGVWQQKNLKTKFHSYVMYNNGYITYSRIISKNGILLEKGYYYENEKIKLIKRYYDSGELWRIYERGLLKEYSKRGNLIHIKKTDPWGNF